MRLSLRWKIVGGFGLLLLLIVLLGYLALSLFTSLRGVQRKVFDDAIPGLVAVDEIVRSYTAQSAAVRGYLIDADPERLDQYENEVETAREYEERALELFRSGRERELLTELRVAGAKFQDLVDERVIPLAADGKRALAFSVLGQKGGGLIFKIEELGAELRAAQDNIVAESEEGVRDRSNQVVVILVVVTIGVLAVGLLLAILLPRRLASNLARLVEAARAIGRGDFDQRVEIRSGDEVEELAQRFGEMQAGLKRLQQLALQDRELEIAASIQQKLLQRTVPHAPGVHLVPLQRQANLVGGDWYDFDFDGDKVVVVVGDASGKGIAAALMATVALSALRAERLTGAPSARVIERANEALIQATDPDSFTTLVYATIDHRSGDVRWLNMGHPPPFLLAGGVRPDGDRGRYLEEGRNRALGWFEHPGVQEGIVRLEPGDRLVLYTDGFLEAKSPVGEQFGEQRFAQRLLASADGDSDGMVDELVREVEAFAAGKLDDDLTMIVVEFQGAAGGQSGAERLPGEEPWHSKR